MYEEVALDKARIVREAGDEWKAASSRWDALETDSRFLWIEPRDQAVEWLAGRLDKAMGMTEGDLRRTVKQYLSSWALARLRKVEAGEPDVPLSPFEWDGMVEDLTKANRMARKKASRKNLDVWIPPKQQVTIGGETVDYTSHEFWSDMYLYAIANPERENESHTAFLRRMGDAGANAKYLSERMPQPHNGTARQYSVSSADSDALVAGIDGKFDEQYQTTHRPVGANRRPMGLRDEDWAPRVVHTWYEDQQLIDIRRRVAKRRFARDPLVV